MAILVANTKLENSDFAWYEFYVDNVADIDSLPTRTSTGKTYVVKKYARPMSTAYCISEARQYMLDSSNNWRPMCGLSDDVLDALAIKADYVLNLRQDTEDFRNAAANSASAAKQSEDNAHTSEVAAANSQTAASNSEVASRTSAESSASSASSSADSANASATSAAESKESAAQSADSASESASSASASASSASAAKASEENAASRAIEALASENAAKQSAQNSANSAVDSAFSASESASSASASASSASAAKVSEENAAASSAAAQASESNALKSENNAADCAASAAQSAEKAKIYVGTDSTLSTEGAPADAKATGDALAGKADKTEVSNALSQKSDTTHTHDLSALINTLSTGSSTPQDADYYVSQYVGGGDTTTTYHRRPMSALWAYIKGKADVVFAAKSHTHNYAGSGSAGGSANSAVKLDTATAGSATKPVYISGGKPVACTHSLDKDVPANAVFTDHTYANMTAATDSAAGKAGLVPAPAAGAQGKFLRGDGTWQAIASSGLSAYPVGSIFQTVSTTSPAELFGGTWHEIAFNRVLMGAGTGYTAGSTVEAGLPNITGSFTTKSTDVGGSPFSGDANVLSAKGSLAFSEKSTSYGGYTGHSGSQYNIQFDASRSNPIYGRSYTVQPAAYYVHIWKRVA
nr:MAG TPA: baseplate protein [Bacteriophage sp.]